ncbi:DUF397 domain-containing protein [Streptomyces sp. GQFP]|uniref:DUF397 domain-containing protein n=1 Tax=Streptomyces sp. GQFP TaxID=2907545 RepID=UPI001F3BB771|nr:DUF397 domain-containing protein [Streptomyces sp. GQFP]UIX34259.1 DUF397 domain-containing protein [Streptomyces sp. GQFP]
MIHKHAVSTELAPEGAWFKSSYSSGEGGACVEIAGLTGQVGVRDSKIEAGPALLVSSRAFNAFIGGITA